MSIIIIPDSEGRIKTVQALLNKIPKGRVIFLGDLVDRGSNRSENNGQKARVYS